MVDQKGVENALLRLAVIFQKISHRPLSDDQRNEVRRLLASMESSSMQLGRLREEADRLCLFIISSGVLEQDREPQGIPEIRSGIDRLRDKLETAQRRGA